MSYLEAALRRLCEELVSANVRFALVGGLAVSVRAEPRFTRDADVAVVAEDDRVAEALVLRLQGRGYSVVSVLEQNATARLATARLQPPHQDGTGTGLLLDLLFASSGIEKEIVESADRLEVFPGVTLPVARTGHLIALKLLSRDDRDRPQDIIDLRSLLTKASPDEMRLAVEAVNLIVSRGYDRGRALNAMLDELSR